MRASAGQGEVKRPLVGHEDLVWLDRELRRSMAEARTQASREVLEQALDEVQQLLVQPAGALTVAHALVVARTALRALADERG